jgi:Tfp pilus assembly protein PilF
LGALYLQQGQTIKALDYLKKAIHEHPKDAEILNHLAFAHFNHGNDLFAADKSAEAIASYEQALTYKPDYTDAMNNLGMVLSHQGHGDQSLPWLQRPIL